jgi:pimeloyl-ACP methyl ester carboxylesterase
MKEYQLILVDIRGYGESDKPHNPEDYQAKIIAQDCTTILDNLKIQKASYLGYSMGGAIGFQCIAKYALSRFNAMVLGGASPYGDVLTADKNEAEERLSALCLAVEKGIEYYVTNYYEKNYGAIDKAKRDQLLATDPQALLSMAAGISNWPSAADILPSIDIPLFVFGGELDPRFPNIRECVKHLPTATFISFPGKKHTGVLSDTNLLLPHIKKFLNRVSK